MNATRTDRCKEPEHRGCITCECPEPSTHGPRRTISWSETRPDTRALVAALRDTLSNEEAWAITQDHLDEARDLAVREYRVLGPGIIPRDPQQGRPA